MSELITIEPTEAWREYDFEGRIYRIEKPVKVSFRVGGTTHRVVDGSGIVHCVPAPGFQGCVLRWKALPGELDVKD